MDAWSTDSNQDHVRFKQIITAQISATWRHHVRQSGGHAAHGSKIKHVPILKRYNGPDQISRETSGPSDQESRGAIGAFLQNVSSD